MTVLEALYEARPSISVDGTVESELAGRLLAMVISADDQGLANLKQMCRYLLFFNTFKHKWVNDSQYDMGGEVMYATLGVKEDLTNLEVDAKTAVRPQDGLVHPFYTYTLSYTKYGYIIRNEDNDMNPELIKRLVACRNDLAALQVDIRDIRCTINI